MKFLCLGYHNEASFRAISGAERDEIMTACFAQCVPFRATGKVVEEEMVEAACNARTIRPVNGKPTVRTGPFTEAKEQIGAFFIIEAENMDEAVEVMSLHPGALLGEKYGFGLEIRPF